MNDKSLGKFAEAPPGELTGSDTQGASQRSPKHDLIFLRSPRTLLDDLLTTLFPGDCRLCAAPLLRASALPVCEPCLSNLRPQSETHPASTLCIVCGEAVGFESERFVAGRDIAGPSCTPCRRVPPPFTRAAAFGVYQKELRGLIGLLKFDRLRSTAKPLGRLLAHTIADLAPAFDPTTDTLVVAVPLFRGKARERGFNQAELLVTHALGSLRRSNPTLRLQAAHHLLARTRQTESQFGLNPRQRRQNLRGAFTVPQPALVAGRDVLLVDDIYTTGATARACAAALTRAGARNLFVATVSRAQPETVALWDTAAFEPVAATTFHDRSTASHQRA